MNAEITILQRRVLDLYEQQRTHLAGKPRQFVEDLLHDAEHAYRDSDCFSARTAAQINIAAASMVLEAPGGAAAKGTKL